MTSLRDFNGKIASYGDIVREERFFCAVLFHLLLSNRDFLKLFIRQCTEPPFSFSENDTPRVFVEYAMARDLWEQIERDKNADRIKAKFLLRWVKGLDGSLPEEPSKDDIARFNEKIGSTRAPKEDFHDHAATSSKQSRSFIHTPGRWSITKISESVFPNDPEAIEEACKLKWAFNVKPDVVIELNQDSIICIEAKLGSRESKYPPAKADIVALGKHFKGKRWTQTDIQQFLMEKILNFKCEGIHQVLLVMDQPSEDKKKTNLKYLTWKDVFDLMNEGHGKDARTQMAQEHAIVQTARHRIGNWGVTWA